MEHAGRTYAVTGADSGIGAAVADLLQRRGGRVVRCGIGPTVDVRADLGTPAGREDLVREVTGRAADGLDGLALVAGVDTGDERTVAINYFGTLAVLTGLRPLLAASAAPRAVVVTSSSALTGGLAWIVHSCLSGDEDRARALARRTATHGLGGGIYRSTKTALQRQVRRAAPTPEWAGAGILLNAVAPGVVDTATAQQQALADPAVADLLALALPQPLGTPGPALAAAEAVAWLAGPRADFVTGQVLHVDGGCDAVLRGENPYARAAMYSPGRLARLISARARLRRGPGPVGESAETVTRP